MAGVFTGLQQPPCSYLMRDTSAGPGCGLEAVPEDILEIILGQLDSVTIRSARLANKLLYRTATQHITNLAIHTSDATKRSLKAQLRALPSLTRLHIHFHSLSKMDLIHEPGCAPLLDSATINCPMATPSNLACMRLARATALTTLTLEGWPAHGAYGFLASCPRLRNLHLYGSICQTRPHWMEPVFRKTGLQRLCILSEPGCSTLACDRLADLASLPTLHTLGDVLVQSTSQLEVLRQCPLLTSLSLSTYLVLTEGPSPLALLAQLRKLRLTITCDFREDYSHALTPLTHLVELALWGSISSPQALGEGIAGLAGLTCLALHITWEEPLVAFPVRELYSGLACLGKLRRLEVSWPDPRYGRRYYGKMPTRAWSLLADATCLEQLDMLAMPLLDEEVVRSVARDLTALTCLVLEQAGPYIGDDIPAPWHARWLRGL